jgi:hypothetical protein
MSPNFDNDFAWGWGTKLTFARQDKVAWGIALQMNFLDTSWSRKETSQDDIYLRWERNVDIKTWDLLVAVGPTIDMGGWKLYGGPFYYYLDGDYDYKEPGSWDDGEGGTGTWIENYSGDLEAESNFGGYVGAQIPLSEKCDFTTEVSLTGDGWAAGTGVIIRF